MTTTIQDEVIAFPGKIGDQDDLYLLYHLFLQPGHHAFAEHEITLANFQILLWARSSDLNFNLIFWDSRAFLQCLPN